MDFTDCLGRPLTIGDRVLKAAIDDGAPAWAHAGTVVGFARTRVRVEWDSVVYDPDGDPRCTFRLPHATNARALRVL